jgi:hypothetical protein
MKGVRTPWGAVRSTNGVHHMGERRTQHTGLTDDRIHDRLVTSTRTSYDTRMDSHSPQEEPTCTATTQHGNSLGPFARHGGIDSDQQRQAH